MNSPRGHSRRYPPRDGGADESPPPTQDTIRPSVAEALTAADLDFRAAERLLRPTPHHSGRTRLARVGAARRPLAA